MNQQQLTIDNQIVQAAVSLIANGTPQDWNQQYRSMEFHLTLQEKGADAFHMDFEYKDRKVFYRYLNSRFVMREPIDYCEFGVSGGQSFRDWLALNKNPGSRFYGFDSFEGLPEHWHTDAPEGAYTTRGKIPETGDPRAEFVVGLFQDTVEEFSNSFQPRNRLVLHMDADLYSSTLYCLMNFNRHIRPGTIILFDEFNARGYTDEFAALQDYCRACYRDYRFIACRKDYAKMALEITR